MTTGKTLQNHHSCLSFTFYSSARRTSGFHADYSVKLAFICNTLYLRIYFYCLANSKFTGKVAREHNSSCECIRQGHCFFCCQVVANKNFKKASGH